MQAWKGFCNPAASDPLIAVVYVFCLEHDKPIKWGFISARESSIGACPASYLTESMSAFKPCLLTFVCAVTLVFSYMCLISSYSALQALRHAAQTLPQPSFEDILTAADSSPRATLLRPPSVFTLALVWESPQAPVEALKGALEALSPRIDLSRVFDGLAGNCTLNLRYVRIPLHRLLFFAFRHRTIYT